MRTALGTHHLAEAVSEWLYYARNIYVHFDYQWRLWVGDGNVSYTDSELVALARSEGWECGE